MEKETRIIKSWKALSEIMNDKRFSKKPIEMTFKEDVLVSLTFRTIEVRK